MMTWLIRCYRLIAGYGHCCPPNHVAACRAVSKVLQWTDDCYKPKSGIEHPCRGQEHPSR